MNTTSRWITGAGFALAALAAPLAASAQTPAAAPATPAEAEASAAPATAPKRAPRVDRNRITAEQVAASTEPDAYSLVRTLHPEWLRGRGMTSMRASASVRVYQDGAPIGGVQALSQIPRPSVSSIEFLDGMRATQQFGTDHGAGAIIVHTGRY